MKNKISTAILLILLLGIISASKIQAQSGYLFKTIKAHKGAVKSITYTSDGKHLVSAGADGEIIIWNTADYTQVYKINFNGFAVVSADGNLIAASALDKNNKVWLTKNGKEIFSTGKLIDYRRSIAISPDNKIFAGSSFSEVLLFNIAELKLQKTITGHDGWITTICYSPEGKFLATGSSDMSAIIWDTETGAQIRILKGHKAGIHIVKYSPDGKTIATGSADGMIKLWDSATGKEIISIQENESIIKTIAFSPCGRFLLSGGTDKTIKVWQSVNGVKLCSRPAGVAIVNEVSFSADGKFIAVCGENNLIKIFDFEKLIKE